MNEAKGDDVAWCAECGAEVPECSATPADERIPCPACGSSRRRVFASAHSTITFSSWADARVIRYESRLLDEARRLLSEGEPGLAIIIGHTACEVATRRVITTTLASSDLSDALKQVLQPAESTAMTITTRKIGELFEAVTGKEIPKNGGFWEALMKSAKLRNAMAHHGTVPSHESTLASLDAVAQFISFALAICP